MREKKCSDKGLQRRIVQISDIQTDKNGSWLQKIISLQLDSTVFSNQTDSMILPQEHSKACNGRITVLQYFACKILQYQFNNPTPAPHPPKKRQQKIQQESFYSIHTPEQ